MSTTTSTATLPVLAAEPSQTSTESRPESIIGTSEHILDEPSPATTICEHKPTSEDTSTKFKEAKPDIEHVNVQDDPRKWSSARKVSTSKRIYIAHLVQDTDSDHYKLLILTIIACASMLATFASNIYSRESLHASRLCSCGRENTDYRPLFTQRR